MKSEIVIRATAVFERPNRVIAGYVVVVPEIFPRDIEVQVYLASGEVKTITLHSVITTSPEAFRNNLYGFSYSGDVVNESDLVDDVLISNMPYHQAYQLYVAHSKLRS